MAKGQRGLTKLLPSRSRRLSRRLPVMVLGVCFLVIAGVGTFAGLALRGALYEQLDTSLNQSVNQLAQIARAGQGKEVLGTPLGGEEKNTPQTDSSKTPTEDEDSLKAHTKDEAANRISRPSKIPDSIRGQAEEKRFEKPEDPGRGRPGRDFPGVTAGSFSLIYQAGQATSLLVDPGSASRQLSSTQVSQVLSLTLTRPQNVSLTDLGDYRVSQRQVDTPEGTARIASGLPLREVNQTLHSFILFYALGSLAALLGAYLLARFLVRRELRDLTQVEKVARTVENVNLESESHLPTRVRDEVTSKDSEAAQLGRSLNRALEHVESSLKLREESEAQLRQFVADASHELRTPVAAISGYAQLLARQNLGEQAGDAVGRIERESQRLADLVSDLILLARLDAGQNAQVEEVPIAGVIVETFTNMRITYPEHHWELEFSKDLAEVTVVGSESALTQIISNLLANAAQHTPVGTKIQVSAYLVAGDKLQVQVADNGPGIDPRISDTLFNRFVRADTARTPGESSGLGLAIVKTLTEALGGAVTAENRAPSGAVFALTLPRS